MNEKARAHLVIRGRVQGVFYRAYTRDLGTRLGLGGWVRNLPDGSVEAVFEGDREKIEEAIVECRQGPPASRVDDIETRWEEFGDEFDGFSIMYR